MNRHNNAPIFDEDVFSEENIQNPRPLYHRIRKLGPIVWAPSIQSYISARKEVVGDLLMRPAEFSSRISLFGISGLESVKDYNPIDDVEFIMTLDGPAHVQKKRQYVPPFKFEELDRRWRKRAREIVSEQLDSVCSKGSFEAVADLASPLPIRVILEMYGISYENITRDGLPLIPWLRERFLESVHHIGHTRGDRYEQIERNYIANQSTMVPMWISEEIELKREQPDDKLLSFLVSKTDPDDAGANFKLNNDVFFILSSGNLTTTGLLGYLIQALAENPEILKGLQDDRSLVPYFIEETLRYYSPGKSTYRMADCDINIHGVEIKKGEQILLSIYGANSDPESYENPDSFDIYRNIYRKKDGLNQMAHLGFGKGVHMCIGRWLARMEAECVVEEILNRFDSMAIRNPDHIRQTDTIMIRQLQSLALDFTLKNQLANAI